MSNRIRLAMWLITLAKFGYHRTDDDMLAAWDLAVLILLEERRRNAVPAVW